MKKWAVILVVFICFAFGLSVVKLFLVATHPIKFQNDIITFSKQYNLNPTLVASVINVESSYNKHAKSNKNAIGLMQIKLDTANYIATLNKMETIEENDLFNATTNIKFGCMYLSYLMKKFEDKYTAVAAYNAGETRVRTWLNNKEYSLDKKTLKFIPYKETSNYVNRIKSNEKFYQKVYFNN